MVYLHRCKCRVETSRVCETNYIILYIYNYVLTIITFTEHTMCGVNAG